jgi:hypothetical protein
VRNLLFPLLGKGPVFGGGGGGGGGGGDSGGSSGTLTTTASSKSSGDGDRYISIRDRFDGGGKGKPGSTFEGGPFSGVANSLGISPVGSGGAVAATTIEATLRRPCSPAARFSAARGSRHDCRFWPRL